MLNCPNCNKQYNENDALCPHCGYSLAQDNAALSPGTLLQGRYEIAELLHSGHLALIYLARDKKLYDRPCVVKQLREALKSEQEATTIGQIVMDMARFSFPNVAVILDHFSEDNYYFLVTEYIAGKTIEQLVLAGTQQITEEDTIRQFIALCDISAAIHKAGLVYGEISPSTVILSDEGFIQLIDFGLFRKLDEQVYGRDIRQNKFMSVAPEQFKNQLQQPSDVFGTGATCYYMLTGYIPSGDGKTQQTQAGTSPFPPLKNNAPDTSSELTEIIEKALQHDATLRYATAVHMADELKILIKKAPILAIDNETVEFARIMPDRIQTKHFVIENEGAGKLVGRLSSNRPWLSVASTSLDMESAHQEIDITIDTRGFSSGYADEGEISIITNGGRKTVRVNLSVHASATGKILLWASHHKTFMFILLGLVVLGAAYVALANTVLKESTPSEAVIIFEDDFSNFQSGWFTGVDSFGESKYVDGEYMLSITSSNDSIVARSNKSIGPLSDFALDVDIRLQSGPPDTWYGVGFRQQNEENSYDFFIRNKQGEDKASFALFKQVNGNWIALNDWTPSGDLNRGTTANHIRISCRGERMEVFANNSRLCSITDPTYTSGEIVLEARKDAGNSAKVYYDNIVISLP